MRALLAIAALAIVAAAHADYAFLVTNTPAGSNPGPYTNGALRYVIDGSGAATLSGGIAASQLDDPAGLAYDSGIVYVGNREGNATHPGNGTVSRFAYDPFSGAFTPLGSFAANATGTHGVNVSPTTGELFAANVDGPVTRFLSPSAIPIPSGSLNSGSARDVFISADGLYAYVTQGVTGNVLKFSTATGGFLNSFAVPGASGLHFGAWRGDDLFLADYTSGNVYDLTFDLSGNVTSSAVVANTPTSIGVAFSPDGTEMFVPGHTSGVISRFLNAGGFWTLNGTIQTGINMGDIQVLPVPEPLTFAPLGLALLALRRRRKSPL